MPKRPAPTVPAASPTSAPAPLVAAAVYLHVSALRPNPRNPRMHGEEAVRLARTILRTAWGAPIVAQARSRRIIGGHGRLEAALRILASLEVDGELRGGPEHFFDKDAPGPGMVPVRLVDVSDAEADAMTLADNARALQGTDDSVRVLELLAPFGRGTRSSLTSASMTARSMASSRAPATPCWLWAPSGRRTSATPVRRAPRPRGSPAWRTSRARSSAATPSQ
ncbi:MAG: ParB N-terminal domain-containing protein [Deltaproteobacteria bacterium]|nr:ParB N-terminal domain-containing protein [Deltaproteobacteria bacterium]